MGPCDESGRLGDCELGGCGDDVELNQLVDNWVGDVTHSVNFARLTVLVGAAVRVEDGVVGISVSEVVGTSVETGVDEGVGEMVTHRHPT